MEINILIKYRHLLENKMKGVKGVGLEIPKRIVEVEKNMCIFFPWSHLFSWLCMDWSGIETVFPVYLLILTCGISVFHFRFMV